MKSKFARCAKHEKDKEDATSYSDVKRIGNVFSEQAANMIRFACHQTPQMHDMRGTSDNMHGAELYVTRPRLPFMNGSAVHQRKKDDDIFLYALGVMESLNYGRQFNAPTYN